MAIKVWGIDVSKYNAPIDWQKVKNAGVKFAILRVGFASTSNRNNLYLDPYFEIFYKGAKAGFKSNYWANFFFYTSTDF